MIIKPSFGNIEPTEKTAANMWTFDEAGITFDEDGYTFDGLTGNSGYKPKNGIIEIKPKIT